MNLLRGALVFIAMVGLATILECKKEGHDTATPTDTVSTHSPAAASVRFDDSVTCSDGTTADHICHDPCKITVDVSSTTDDDTVDVPVKVWIYAGQQVTWHGREDKDDNKPHKLEKLYFSKTELAKDPKKGDKLLTKADCTTGDCVKTFDDASDCVVYGYTVKPVGKKEKDPEIEVGSTTPPAPIDTSGTSTSGTAGTTATHM